MHAVKNIRMLYLSCFILYCPLINKNEIPFIVRSCDFNFIHDVKPF